jgi:hypothetical protein
MPRGIEWIEIYNPGNLTLNLSEWNIKDNYATDEITCWNILGCSITTNANYFLIIGRNNNITEITNESILYYYVDDTSIGNGLNDNGENISFFNSTYNSNMSYNYSEQNQSWNYFNNSWFLCNPSPGIENCQANQSQGNETMPSISLNFPSQIWNNLSNFSVSVNIFNFSQGFYDLKLDIKINSTYLNRFWTEQGWSDKNSWIDNFTFVNSSNSFNLNLINQIDSSLFGNASIQLKLRNSSGTFESEIHYLDVLNGTVQEEHNNETNQEEKENDSSIKIKDHPENAKFGETIDLELRIYKGSTSKYAVYVYVENDDGDKVSEKKTLHLDDKYENYSEDVELELKCLNESGTYTLIVEGLDEKDEEDIEIESCSGIDETQTTSSQKVSTKSSSSSSANSGNNNQDSFNSLTVTGNSVYESENSKINGKMSYFLLGLVILISIYLIWKKT